MYVNTSWRGYFLQFMIYPCLSKYKVFITHFRIVYIWQLCVRHPGKLIISLHSTNGLWMYYTTARHFITRNFYWIQLNTGYWSDGLFDTSNIVLASLIYIPNWSPLPIVSLQNSRRVCCWSCHGSSPGWWCQVRWWWSECLLQHSSMAEAGETAHAAEKVWQNPCPVADVPADVLTWGWQGGTSAHKGFIFRMVTETNIDWTVRKEIVATDLLHFWKYHLPRCYSFVSAV